MLNPPLAHAHFLSVGSGKRGRHLLAVAALLTSGTAHALQPLETFLEGARSASTSNRRAAFVEEERRSEAQGRLGAVLPSVSASGSATRNESAITLPTGGAAVEIQPLNQLNGSVGLSVPLVDAAGWARWSAARSTVKAARESARATRLETERKVANAYYTLVGAGSLTRARVRSLDTAQQDLTLTRTRRIEGTATALDVARAEAEVEKVRQQRASADLTAALARRTLLTLTGVEAEQDADDLGDDLRPEPPLSWWEERGGSGAPAIAVASAERDAAQAQARAAKLALVPTLSATAKENVTNAGGLTGQTEYRTLTANLSWTFDLTTVATIRAQSAAASAAQVAQEAVVAQTRDEIHEAWQRVTTGIGQCRSARAQASAAKVAAEVARERYGAGTGTQLELVQAERDLLDAEAARIQADADLAYARASLRLAAGLPGTARIDDVSRISHQEENLP